MIQQSQMLSHVRIETAETHMLIKYTNPTIGFGVNAVQPPYYPYSVGGSHFYRDEWLTKLDSVTGHYL